MVAANALTAGFTGLTAFQSESASGLSAEPPDQGFCVGDGKIFELVNVVAAAYDESGNLLGGPTFINDFFGVPSTDFLSDPRCYYDAATDNFFFSITDLGNYPTSLANSSLLVAIMSGSSLTLTVYLIDTTDDGSNGITHPNCPCFEDQPLLGADANGIYLTGNEFPLDPNNLAFNGAQIYALDKADLVARVSSPAYEIAEAPIHVGKLNGSVAASIQPAFSSGGVFATGNGGTEYLMSALDFNGTGDHRIAVWAIINTCGWASNSAAPLCQATPTLLSTVINSKHYSNPPNATQEAGNIPLGTAVGGTLETLMTDDDRMQQVMFANNNLYSALTTGGKFKNTSVGILYFIVSPSITRKGKVKAKIVRQNYLTQSGLALFYPSLAATNSGAAAMTFSFSGQSAFPGVAYAQIPASKQTPIVINTAANGAGPYDGGSGYAALQGTAGIARWGDYSAAVVDGSNIWMATEYVSGSCDSAEYAIDQTCGGQRGVLSNWGTFVSELTP